MTKPRLSPITRRLGITPRIRALASCVPHGTGMFVDVGTNHAILPIAVVRAARAQRCVGTDSSAPALADARRRLLRSRCTDRVELRRGDGLLPVAAEPVDVVCIAGLGPHTMVAILGAGLSPLRQRPVRLVLNPFGGSAIPRAFLAEHGLPLTADFEVAERGRSYTILVVDLPPAR